MPIEINVPFSLVLRGLTKNPPEYGGSGVSCYVHIYFVWLIQMRFSSGMWGGMNEESYREKVPLHKLHKLQIPGSR